MCTGRRKRTSAPPGEARLDASWADVVKWQQFLAEMKTRGVYRVSAIYCAGAWALLQVSDLLFPMLGLPDGSVTLVLAAAAAGFPVALVLAWLFDLTPEGVVSAPASDAAPRGRLSPAHVVELSLMLLLCVLVGYLYFDRLTPAPAERASLTQAAANGRPSIAVMPFISIGESEDARYIGDGVAEEVLNLLARLNELNVASRTSSFYFRGKDVSLATIAERLGVGHLLEGSVRREGERVRISAQLVDAASGFNVWSETYDRDLGGLLELQDDIARQVVTALQVVLSERSSAILDHDTTVEPVAYDYYLRGRDYLRRQVDTFNLETGLSFFRRALEISPNFASAWAGVCDAQLALYEQHLAADQFAEAEAACQRALGLEPDAGPVYTALGNLYRVSGRHVQALAQFERALDLNPASVDAYLGRGKTRVAMDKDAQARDDFLTAIELQPNFWRAYNELGVFYFESGDFAQALPFLQRVASLNPGSDTTFNNLGSTYYMLGDVSQAAEAWQQSVALNPSADTLSNLGTSLFFSGRFEEAAARYRQAADLSPEHHVFWGNRAEALRFVPERDAEEQQALQRAIDLAQSQLAINPADRVAQAMLASYLVRQGDAGRARELLAALPEGARNSLQVQYYTAVTYTELGDSAAALQALEQALSLGYPRRLLALDPNFGSLRPTPQFQALAAE